jgi:hypothetical protein
MSRDDTGKIMQPQSTSDDDTVVVIRANSRGELTASREKPPEYNSDSEELSLAKSDSYERRSLSYTDIENLDQIDNSLRAILKPRSAKTLSPKKDLSSERD